MSILEHIKNHNDLTALPDTDLPLLAEEIRERLIETVSCNGGHLAANLGVVELTIALERCFDSAADRIIWDVGHQVYVHKLLTGRSDVFDSLRKKDGISGFPSPAESQCDAFISGHAGNALSVASGMAVAGKLTGSTNKIVAVTGDASIACGISLEALNLMTRNSTGMIMILNDNTMAISRTVGGLSTHLTRLISSRGYNRIKRRIKKMLGPGSRFSGFISRITDMFKYGMIPSSLFDILGVRYFGPINGHDIHEMERIFTAVKDLEHPVIVHVVTTKGKGYLPAEKDPEKFHGISPFNSSNGEVPVRKERDFSACFGDKLAEMASADKRICAITAGMPQGTGLSKFAAEYPERFFDVGIAEEHGAVFAAGLAAAGMKPVLALYSSFSQRCFDCFFQDISLAGMPVVVAVDRAGAVEDGPTHHGLRDIALLRTLKNFTFLAPADGKELEMMLEFALESPCPVAIRYPRGTPPAPEKDLPPLHYGKARILADGNDCAIWAVGTECAAALKAREILANHGICAKVVNVRFLNPFDRELACECCRNMPIFTLEDHLLEGGLFSIMTGIAAESGITGHKIYGFGWHTDPGHGKVELLKQEAGLDAESVALKIRSELQNQ